MSLTDRNRTPTNLNTFQILLHRERLVTDVSQDEFLRDRSSWVLRTETNVSN